MLVSYCYKPSVIVVYFFMLVSHCYKPSVTVVYIFILVSYCYKPSVIVVYIIFMLVSYCYNPYVIVVFIFYVSLLLLQTVCHCCIYILCKSPIATNRLSLLFICFMLVSYCYKPSVIVVFIFYVSLILL